MRRIRRALHGPQHIHGHQALPSLQEVPAAASARPEEPNVAYRRQRRGADGRRTAADDDDRTTGRGSRPVRRHAARMRRAGGAAEVRGERVVGVRRVSGGAAAVLRLGDAAHGTASPAVERRPRYPPQHVRDAIII